MADYEVEALEEAGRRCWRYVIELKKTGVHVWRFGGLIQVVFFLWERSDQE